MPPRSTRFLGKVLVGQVGRVAYGNDAGVLNNVRGRTRLRAARSRTDGAPRFDRQVSAAAARFDSFGWIPIAGSAEADEIVRIRSRCDDLLDDPSHSVDLGFPPRSDAVRHIVDPIMKIPELANLLPAQVVETLSTTYRAHVEVRSVRVWRTVHVPDGALRTAGRLRRHRAVSVMSNLMHCDSHPVSLAKFFVQLSPDVGVATGALQLLPIPATKRAMRRGFVRPDIVVGPARGIIADADRIIIFDGPPGSGLLFNSELCLHAAGVPRPGSSRVMLQFVLGP